MEGQGLISVRLHTVPHLRVAESAVSEKSSIFPNPTHDLLNITLPDSVDTKSAGIRIVDAYGRLVKRIDGISHANNISVSGLAAGLYFVEIYADRKLISTQKVIKD
jgi:hypothetical protein